MILLLAVVAGVAAGLLRAWIKNREYLVVELKAVWLVLLAVIPQIFAFQLSSTARLIPDALAQGILVSSQILLLIFVWVNRLQPGFWVLGLGLGLNMLVILLNNNWMPISPTAVQALVPDAPIDSWQLGNRLGITKDIVLPINETKFWYLSDRFLLPKWGPWRVAFSLGDVFIAMGAFWLLWTQASPRISENQK